MDEFDDLVASIGSRRLACILTPVASAKVLAGLAALANMHVHVLDTATGAVVLRELTDEPDPFAQLSGSPSGEAADSARTLEKLIHTDVILVVSTLTPGEDGSMEAWKFSDGAEPENVAPGLFVAALDSQVEDFLIGERFLSDLAVIDTSTLTRLKASRMLSRGLKRGKK